jgi:hypothetical protein
MVEHHAVFEFLKPDNTLVLINCILVIIDFGAVRLQLGESSIIVGENDEDDWRVGRGLSYRVFSIRIG